MIVSLRADDGACLLASLPRWLTTSMAARCTWGFIVAPSVASVSSATTEQPIQSEWRGRRGQCGWRGQSRCYLYPVCEQPAGCGCWLRGSSSPSLCLFATRLCTQLLCSSNVQWYVVGVATNLQWVGVVMCGMVNSVQWSHLTKISASPSSGDVLFPTSLSS